MKQAMILVVLSLTSLMGLAQGTVLLDNQTGLVRTWTSVSDSTLIGVPKSGGYVQLFAAPKGTALPNPLFAVGSGGLTLNYSSLAGFLAANPGWAGAVNSSGAVPVLIALGAGLFNGGTFTITNISEGANADYFLLGWTGTYTSFDAAIVAWNYGGSRLGVSAVTTTATGDPLLTPPGTAVSLKATFAGLDLLLPIPEPPPLSLIGLGALVLMSFARRRSR